METGPQQGWISLLRIDCEKWDSIVINKNQGRVLGKGHNAKIKRGTATSSEVNPTQKSTRPVVGWCLPAAPGTGLLSAHSPHCHRCRALSLPVASSAAPHSCSQPCSCQCQAQPVAQSSASSWNWGWIEGVICHHVKGSTLRGALGSESPSSQRHLNMSLSRKLLNKVIVWFAPGFKLQRRQKDVQLQKSTDLRYVGELTFYIICKYYLCGKGVIPRNYKWLLQTKRCTGSLSSS